MKLFLRSHLATLRANGAKSSEAVGRDGKTEDFRPVVKLFTPWGGATWLLTEIIEEIPEEEGQRADTILFGLCCLGQGFPELGTVSLNELTDMRGPGGLKVERDRHWTATAPLSSYTQASREQRRLVDELDPLIGQNIRTRVPDMNEVEEVGEVTIPPGHTGWISHALGHEEFAVSWDDLNGHDAGWTIWDRAELLRDAELIGMRA